MMNVPNIPKQNKYLLTFLSKKEVIIALKIFYDFILHQISTKFVRFSNSARKSYESKEKASEIKSLYLVTSR